MRNGALKTGRLRSAKYKIMEYDLTPDFVDQQNTILKNLKKASVNALAMKVLDTSKMFILIVLSRSPQFEYILLDAVVATGGNIRGSMSEQGRNSGDFGQPSGLLPDRLQVA